MLAAFDRHVYEIITAIVYGGVSGVSDRGESDQCDGCQ